MMVGFTGAIVMCRHCARRFRELWISLVRASGTPALKNMPTILVSSVLVNLSFRRANFEYLKIFFSNAWNAWKEHNAWKPDEINVVLRASSPLTTTPPMLAAKIPCLWWSRGTHILGANKEIQLHVQCLVL